MNHTDRMQDIISLMKLAQLLQQLGEQGGQYADSH